MTARRVLFRFVASFLIFFVLFCFHLSLEMEGKGREGKGRGVACFGRWTRLVSIFALMNE